ncbi:gluconate:H+ symporter [Rhodoplanes sp. TEM]|uniref:Gluconate:H+ symporter n=1 Tax=Rhodoplanes tepidamans TaxID=200616 RepID=A0ABT5JDR2_RHOTP|nr:MULTISPECIES: gluconate:H+ symporter [Rhodoplanes]MDC7787643.1 gluconate:H+ symporter [Rhodoplanes tepidamans]MDC7984541.1 gluconate:H+ symporter [Rhodoplanes sp. TEM]MDQ0355213.1 GntP family gluconate:H+ symporter/D-serine transporter [Rhodoplanes tepidamans]
MSSGFALSVLGVSVVLIIVMCVRFKISAFLALMFACFFIGLSTGMPLTKIGTSIESGMGGTLGFLAPILAFGAVIGKLMEISGGAERLARTLINILGKSKAHWAMLIVGYVCGIPVFFQVGVVLLIALMFSVVKESKLPVLQVGLSMVAALLTVHCIVPPHPAAMAIALQLKADVGKVIFYGLLVGFPAAALAGPIFGKYISRVYKVEPTGAFAGTMPRDDKDLPPFGITLFTILFPLLLMINKTFFDLLAPKDAVYMPFVAFIGNPIVALFISSILTYAVLGLGRGFTLEDLGKQTEASFGPMASIILVIGAAGSFNKIIMDCGMGDVLKQVLTAIHISPLIMAWLIAILMRFAIGSATVAMMTGVGFIMPVLANYPGLDPALVAVAVGAGAIGASHVTDSGFWFVKECLGIPMKAMYATFTLSTTIAAVVGLIGVLILAQFV